MLTGPTGAGQLQRELRALVEAARHRARDLGRPVAAVHTRIEAAAADPLELLAAAERSGERRFFAARPSALAIGDLLETRSKVILISRTPGSSAAASSHCTR